MTVKGVMRTVPRCSPLILQRNLSCQMKSASGRLQNCKNQLIESISGKNLATFTHHKSYREAA